jgi:rhamnosyltransferase
VLFSEKSNVKVGAVVVTFNPNFTTLNQMLNAITGQVDVAIIVDNSSFEREQIRQHVSEVMGRDGSLITLDENVGIGAAQNLGINTLLEKGATHVLLLDQDSVPSQGMVHELLAAEKKLAMTHSRIAAVAANICDEKLCRVSHFQSISGFRFKQLSSKDGAYVEVDLCAASGMLIRREVFETVGLMNVALFIDQVDIEWVQRAKSVGFSVFGVHSAKLNHSLGDSSVTVFGRTFPVHKPFRRYYMFRNAVWMYRQPHVSFRFKVADAVRMPARALLYVATSGNKSLTLRMILTGIIHGFKNRMGRLKS